MAALHAASSPACLRCLTRRALSRPAVFGLASGSSSSSNSSLWTLTSTMQTRGKKTGRRGDNGVVVRLLQDVPQFGQKETILRIDRGRMRNLWYPRGIADYVTTAGSTVSDRDPFFGIAGSPPPDDASSPATARTALPSVDAARAAALLDRLPPLVFARRPLTATSTAIFGSVSADDVAAALRAALQSLDDGSDEAARFRVDGRDVRFVVEGDALADGLGDAAPASSEAEATADRVKALGRWEVEIAVRGGGTAAAPVRKIIEVVAQ